MVRQRERQMERQRERQMVRQRERQMESIRLLTRSRAEGRCDRGGVIGFMTITVHLSMYPRMHT